MRLAAVLLLATLGVADDGEGTAYERCIAGRVLGEDGEPVRGASVLLKSLRDEEDPAVAGITAEADVDGVFHMDAVTDAEVVVRVIAPGYATARFRGRLRTEKPSLDLRVRKGSSVRVRVEDGTGRPVAGATVGLFPMPRVIFVGGGYPTILRVDRMAATGPDGTCTLTGLVERSYDVVAISENQGRASASLCCGTSEVRIVLRGRNELGHRFVYGGLPGTRNPLKTLPSDPAPPLPAPDAPAHAPSDPPSDTPDPPAEDEPTTATVRVRVVSAAGFPVPDADVTMSWADGPGRRGLGEGSAGPDCDGFKFTDEVGNALLVLEPGRYSVTVITSFADETTKHDDIAVRAGEERELEIRLGNVFAVPVEVTDADGCPLPSVELDVRRGGKSERLWTGADGRLTVLAVRGTALSILAMPAGRPAASSGTLELPVSEPVVLRIPRPGRIAGRILDPDGTPLFGVAVVLRREGLEDPDGEEWTVRSDEHGDFSCTGPADGTYTVAAYAFAYRETLVRAVAAAGAQPVEVRLRRMPRIRGRVVGPAGEPLARVHVACDDGRSGSVVTGSDGSFTMPYRRASAEATLEFRLEGFETRELTVDPERAEAVDVKLGPRDPPK